MGYSNTTGLPSVSDIIGLYEDERFYKKYESHRIRGDIVHEFAVAHFKNLMTPHIPEDVEPYIISFQEFVPHIKRVVLIEKRLEDHAVSGTTGQIDILAVMNKCKWFDDGSQWILDWKTSKSKNRLWKAKAGGYSHIANCENLDHDGFATVRLRGELGRPPLVDKFSGATLDEAIQDYLAASRVYHNLTDRGKLFAEKQEVDYEY